MYKAYGFTEETLNDDNFLTKVGSVAAFMGAMRFVWSAFMDFQFASYKLIYGTLLLIQTTLGATIDLAA